MSQIFELAQQRRYRERTGVARLTRTQWTIAHAEVQNIAETEQRFFTALYLRQLDGIAKSVAGLNEKLHGVLVRRLKAGTASAADVALAKIETSSSRQQADLARARFETDLVNLQAHLGLEKTEPIVLIGNLEVWRWSSAMAALERTGCATGKPGVESDAIVNLWAPLTAGCDERPRRGSRSARSI